MIDLDSAIDKVCLSLFLIFGITAGCNFIAAIFFIGLTIWMSINYYNAFLE